MVTREMAALLQIKKSNQSTSAVLFFPIMLSENVLVLGLKDGFLKKKDLRLLFIILRKEK